METSENVPKKRSNSKSKSGVKTSNTMKPKSKSNEHELHTYVEGDGWNIALLLFLYLLQGIPLGLSAAIPIILQNRKIGYKDQAEFSFVFWPFSMKLLWAPIVDAYYSNRFGRRKSWLIPVQLLIGLFLILISMNVNDLLGDEKGIKAPNIKWLTIIFFICNFLAATQDIAVDGWALTMLHRQNVGHASTCNSVGQTAGYFLGYVLFIALDSADFCNQYLFWLRPGSDVGGIVSFDSFVYFWGIVFLISTILVAFIKRESNSSRDESSVNNKDVIDETNMSIQQSYKLLWEILKLKPVQILAVILLTVKIGFSACDSVSPLKLVENGVPKDKLALLAVPLIPVQICLPFLISRYLIGPRPMDGYMKVIPLRLFMGILVAGLVYITPLFGTDGQFPYYFYSIILLVYGFHQSISYIMHVAVMAFFAKISDPRFGGTYMTLLNTLSNLGGSWSSTTMLALVDVFTWKSCPTKCPPDEDCKCKTIVDGFYIEVVICSIIGLFWVLVFKRHMKKIQDLKTRDWLVDNRQNKSK